MDIGVSGGSLSPVDDSPQRRHILFFRNGSFSHINDRVAGWLRAQFPGRELVEIDILQDVIKSSPTAVALGAAAALGLYLPRIAAGDHDFRALFYRTPFLYWEIWKIIQAKYGRLAETSLFSIQTQSLWEGGLARLPHFLCTDHTHLANLRHPGGSRSRLYARSWIRLERALYHRVSGNLVMSDFVRKSLLEDYRCPESKIALVGAAPNLPAPDALPENDGYGNRTILFVGIDWERKGGPVLIEAFKKILEMMPDARLLIAGASPAVRLPNVEVLGRVPLAEVSRLLLRSAVLALPSLKEPQGVNAIEALLHRIPVVASRVGALPEMVEDGVSGIIVPAGDAEALAGALIKMLANPGLCRQYGEAGRTQALRTYSEPVVAQKMGDAIRNWLKQDCLR